MVFFKSDTHSYYGLFIHDISPVHLFWHIFFTNYKKSMSFSMSQSVEDAASFIWFVFSIFDDAFPISLVSYAKMHTLLACGQDSICWLMWPFQWFKSLKCVTQSTPVKTFDFLYEVSLLNVKNWVVRNYETFLLLLGV